MVHYLKKVNLSSDKKDKINNINNTHSDQVKNKYVL